MSQTKRRQIGYKQRIKRHKKRLKLKKSGVDPDQCFTQGIYMGLPKAK